MTDNVTRLRSRVSDRGLALLSKWIRLEAETLIAKFQGRLAHPSAQEETEADILQLIKGCTITISVRATDISTSKHDYVQGSRHHSGEDHDPS